MKVFVTGVAGQLGFDVVNELKKRGHVAIGSDIVEATDSSADEYIAMLEQEAAKLKKYLSITSENKTPIIPAGIHPIIILFQIFIILLNLSLSFL